MKERTLDLGKGIWGAAAGLLATAICWGRVDDPERNKNFCTSGTNDFILSRDLNVQAGGNVNVNALLKSSGPSTRATNLSYERTGANSDSVSDVRRPSMARP